MERDDEDQRRPAAGPPQGPRPTAEIRQLHPRRAKPPKPRPYERPRGGPARQVADLVPQIGRTAFRKFGFVQSSVVTRWPEIVGERHARVCAPELIRFPFGEKSGGTLHLVVLPAHAPLIQHVIPEIITRVNRFFGYAAVAKVRLRQGPVQPGHNEGAGRERGREQGRAPLSLRPIPLELGESLRDIGDPELRAVLESLARSLGRSEDEDDRTR